VENANDKKRVRTEDERGGERRREEEEGERKRAGKREQNSGQLGDHRSVGEERRISQGGLRVPTASGSSYRTPWRAPTHPH
jgi:hypothetical protein